jgi:glycosyltransferase involved in cell wall biosynthesis
MVLCVFMPLSLIASRCGLTNERHPPRTKSWEYALNLPETRAARVSNQTLRFPSASIVIPTLNEAENLRLLLPTIPVWIDEVIVVDGRSTDATIQVAESFADRLPMRVILEKRKGKGAALAAGFAAAQSEIIVAIDADCSMHPCEIPLLISALTAGADFAKGSRFIQGGGSVDLSRFRAIGNRGLTLIVKLLYGVAFSDLCYGYFAFWRRHLPIINPTCDGFEVETFIKLQAIKSGLHIAEVPSFETLRVHGASNLRAVPDGFRVLRTILRERRTAMRSVDGFVSRDLRTYRSFEPAKAAVPAAPAHGPAGAPVPAPLAADTAVAQPAAS